MTGRVCPVWVGYLLASSVRKLLENPEKILSPYVKQDMKVLDAGSAMGFFSLPLARMVGPNGKVICVDMQEKMIQSLKKRARKAGLSDRIELHTCNQKSLCLDELKEKIDFALASAVVHEVTDASSFFSEIYEGIKLGGKFLVIEPKGHVTEKDFEVSTSVAVKIGFSVIDNPKIPRSRSVLFEKDRC